MLIHARLEIPMANINSRIEQKPHWHSTDTIILHMTEIAIAFKFSITFIVGSKFLDPTICVVVYLDYSPCLQVKFYIYTFPQLWSNCY